MKKTISSMTESTFFDLFWQHKAIQNLFLLSKEEFLDTKRFTFGDKPINISFPRIILSNIKSKEDYNHSKITIRTNTHNQKVESIISATINKYQPILIEFIESRFSKVGEQIIKDISEDPLGFIVPIVTALMSGKAENCIIELLQKYELIGYNIKTFQQLEQHIEKELISKNLKTVLSEQNLWAFLELMKMFKDRYVSEVYKSLYNSNQILVSSFHDIDNFADRLKLFNALYDANIIKPSSEDSFIECTECLQDTYRGVFSLKMNPNQLKKMKCPICSSSVSYYVPYELDSTIYEIVKDKDGMLLQAIRDLLKRNRIKHDTNIPYLNDIEIDCQYQLGKELYFLESKMYKQNTDPRKLQIKLKEHFAKLIRDVERIQKQNPEKLSITPLLVVNINDSQLLNKIATELKKLNASNELFSKAKIITLKDLPVKK